MTPGPVKWRAGESTVWEGVFGGRRVSNDGDSWVKIWKTLGVADLQGVGRTVVLGGNCRLARNRGRQ